MSETRPSANAVESETRPTPTKSGLKTGLKYYNTSTYTLQLNIFLSWPVDQEASISEHMEDSVTYI